jgi:hypothetical protein
VLLVVGDRVTGTARRLLTVRGAGYYDLRGHLALRSENLVIDADVDPVAGRAEREHALSGNAGMGGRSLSPDDSDRRHDTARDGAHSRQVGQHSLRGARLTPP